MTEVKVVAVSKGGKTWYSYGLRQTGFKLQKEHHAMPRVFDSVSHKDHRGCRICTSTVILAFESFQQHRPFFGLLQFIPLWS